MTTTTGVPARRRAWRGTRLGWLGLLPVAGVLLATVAAAPASAGQLRPHPAPARQAGHHRPIAGVPMTLAQAPAGLRAAVRATLGQPATAPAGSAAQASLVAGDGQADFFGVSIAISGDTALVGGTTAHHHTGAAYVFVHGARGWTQQARLVAADGVALDNFGFSVALDGNTAVVGAPVAAGWWPACRTAPARRLDEPALAGAAATVASSTPATGRRPSQPSRVPRQARRRAGTPVVVVVMF